MTDADHAKDAIEDVHKHPKSLGDDQEVGTEIETVTATAIGTATETKIETVIENTGAEDHEKEETPVGGGTVMIKEKKTMTNKL